MKNIFIGPSVRSGGSLLNRLFDSHSDVLSYPFEFYLPIDEALHVSQMHRGQRKNIQNFPSLEVSKSMRYESFGFSSDQKKCQFGKRFLGDRFKGKNTGLSITSELDHELFISELDGFDWSSYTATSALNHIHASFSKSWQSGQFSNKSFSVFHSGNGLLADVEQYLNESEDNFFIQPIRSVRGYLASEKRKVVNQVILSTPLLGRIPFMKKMDSVITGRFVEQILTNWLITVTRSFILKRKLGDRYIVYKHEDLVQNPESIMDKICDSIGLEYNESLLNPSIIGVPWRGNSMLGLQSGISKSLLNERHVFKESEEALIKKYCGAINAFLDDVNGDLVDYDGLDQDLLFDYAHQEKYYSDRDKTALYFSGMYERWAYDSLSSVIKRYLKTKGDTYFL